VLTLSYKSVDCYAIRLNPFSFFAVTVARLATVGVPGTAIAMVGCRQSYNESKGF
jgi:hypothetical protein